MTVLNRRTGPVDSITIRSWDVPHGVKKPPDFGEKADWDIYRPTLDIDRLATAFRSSCPKGIRCPIPSNPDDAPDIGGSSPPDFGEKADWDIYRPTLDIDRLWELAEEYLRLFQEPDTEMR